MKRKYLLLIPALLFFVLISSCRKDINYVFWGIDTTNWDNMYKIYKPVFANLDINKTSDV